MFTAGYLFQNGNTDPGNFLQAFRPVYPVRGHVTGILLLLQRSQDRSPHQIRQIPGHGDGKLPVGKVFKSQHPENILDFLPVSLTDAFHQKKLRFNGEKEAVRLLWHLFLAHHRTDVMECQIFGHLPGIIIGSGDFHTLRHIPSQAHIGFQFLFHEKLFPEIRKDPADGFTGSVPAHGKYHGEPEGIHFTAAIGDTDFFLYILPDIQPQFIPQVRLLAGGPAAQLHHCRTIAIPFQRDIPASQIRIQFLPRRILSQKKLTDHRRMHKVLLQLQSGLQVRRAVKQIGHAFPKAPDRLAVPLRGTEFILIPAEGKHHIPAFPPQSDAHGQPRESGGHTQRHDQIFDGTDLPQKRLFRQNGHITVRRSRAFHRTKNILLPMQGKASFFFPEYVIHRQLVRRYVTAFPGYHFLETLPLPFPIQHECNSVPMYQVRLQLPFNNHIIEHHHQRPLRVLIAAEGKGLGHHQLFIRIPLIPETQHILAVYIPPEQIQQLLIAFASQHPHGSIPPVIRRNHHLIHNQIFPLFKKEINLVDGGIKHGVIRQGTDIQIHIVIILFLPDLDAKLPQLRGIADIAPHISRFLNTPVHLQSRHIQRGEHLFLLYGQKQAGSRKINDNNSQQRGCQYGKIRNQQIHG